MKCNINIRISQEQKKEFETVCQALGTPMSEVLRNFIQKVNSLSLQESDMLFKGLRSNVIKQKQDRFKISTSSL